MNDVLHVLQKHRIIPVVVIDHVGQAVPLANTLMEGGLPLMEVTFRSAVAAEAIKAVRKRNPAMLVGAGTILTTADLRMAIDAGASFGVAPGFDHVVAQMAVKESFPFFPGVMTPTDIQGALMLNITVLKFFPAEAAGGPLMIRSLLAPFSHLGIRVIPTGGINPGNLNKYLEVPEVLAAGGTWIARKEEIAMEKWDEIKQRCREATGLVVQK